MTAGPGTRAMVKGSPGAALRLWEAHRGDLVLLGLLAGLLVWAGWEDPSFVRPAAQLELSTHIWELALLAIPMTLVIITAGIDLSVGSLMGLCAVVLGLSYEAGLSPWAGAGLALLAGLAGGALNGVFVAWVRVHPLIVTLATLSAYRGIAEGISLGRPVSGFPRAFTELGQGAIGGVPVQAVPILLVAALAAVALWKTPLGRSLYAIGHNEQASRFSGLPVARTKLLLYALSGLAAAGSAILFVARRNTAKADAGTGMELDVITAVVLGGTSIFGGRGTILGTALGVLLIHETREFLSWHWQRDELRLIVIGVLLIGSVLLGRVRRARAGT